MTILNFGADLTFVSDSNCTGLALFGRTDLPSISCYDLTYLDPTKSVILANLAPGEKITFFSDTACENELYSSSQNVCYTEPDGVVRSFSVRTNGTSADAAASTTDVVPYGVRLSSYKGLSQTSPYNIDLNFSRFATGIIVGVTGQLIVLSSIAVGCAITDSTNVLAIYGCIAGPIATVISWVGTYLVSTGGAAVGTQVREGFNMALGNIVDVKVKRELVDEANSNFMSSLMERDGDKIGEHVGFQMRDMGNGLSQRSPLYEVDSPGGKFHMAAFLDERSGTFTYHIHRAEDSNLTARYDQFNKRQVSYDDARWNTNGLDFNVCAFGGSTSGWSSDPTQNWQTVYDQFQCEFPPNNDGGLTTTATNVEVDLYNEAATVIGSVQIVGYSGSTTVNPPSCQSPSAGLNEDCIIA